MILGFAHPAIVVKNLDRAINFYCQAFGFRELSEQFESWRDVPAIDAAIGLHDSAVRGRMLAGHNCFLELFQFLFLKIHVKGFYQGWAIRHFLIHHRG